MRTSPDFREFTALATQTDVARHGDNTPPPWKLQLARVPPSSEGVLAPSAIHSHVFAADALRWLDRRLIILLLTYLL